MIKISGQPRDIEKSPCKTYTLRAKLNVQDWRATVILKCRFSRGWNFIYKRECENDWNSTTIRITFRYSRRDNLHEGAHLIVTNSLIAAYTHRMATQTSDTIYCRNWSFFVFDCSRQKKYKTALCPTCILCYGFESFVTNIFHLQLFTCTCIDWPNKVLQDLTLVALAMLLIQHRNKCTSICEYFVPLMAILCFADEIDRVLNRGKKTIESTAA